MTPTEIRTQLAEAHDVEIDNVKTGAEATEEEAGLYYGEADAWLVFGEMPNTNIVGWFFAGYTEDFRAF